MNEHVTVDDLAHFRAGALPADGTLRVARHLAQCRECATAARRSQDAVHVADGFRAALGEEGRARRRWLPAVAAVAVIGVVAALLYMTRAASPPPIRPRLAARADYGRADWNALVTQSLAGGRIAVPADLAELRPPGGTVRSSATPARPVEPRGVVVESDRPRFSWPDVPHALTYRVVVYRGEREVMRSPELKTTAYMPERPLERGAVYQWQVLATRDDETMEALPLPPAGPALIRVLSAADAADLADARRRFPADPLLAGLLEARAGLIDEARRDLAAAARQHSGDAAIARLLDALPAAHP